MDKQFKKRGTKKLLIEQIYPAEKHIIDHFNTLLPGFKDHRYIRVNNKPLFLIYLPNDIPNIKNFITTWQNLANENGLEGIHFIAHARNKNEINFLIEKGFDAVIVVDNSDFFKLNYSLIQRAYLKFIRIIFKRAKILDFRIVSEYHIIKEMLWAIVIPV